MELENLRHKLKKLALTELKKMHKNGAAMVGEAMLSGGKKRKTVKRGSSFFSSLFNPQKTAETLQNDIGHALKGVAKFGQKMNGHGLKRDLPKQRTSRKGTRASALMGEALHHPRSHSRALGGAKKKTPIHLKKINAAANKLKKTQGYDHKTAISIASEMYRNGQL